MLLTTFGQLSPWQHRCSSFLALGHVGAQGLTQHFLSPFIGAHIVQTICHILCYRQAAMTTSEGALLVAYYPAVVWARVPEEEIREMLRIIGISSYDYIILIKHI